MDGRGGDGLTVSTGRKRGDMLRQGVFEEHYTAQELAEIWKLDETTIRRIFQDEPGVLRIGKLGRRDGKRDYITLRIPASVATRVYQQRTA
jgi:hypothetical protein